ncbi:MAG: RpiB/LacA/LacB family sugar-phosphate isomerase [bacterium]|nr:RpiB/LacA/LacB family sugar-phosphate isomerase [bacterium]
MKIYLASDHAGFRLKEAVKKFLLKKKYQVKDQGASFFVLDDDYPDFIKSAAKAISKNPKDRAIIFGGSGQGEAIMANRFKNVRAAVVYKYDKKIITLSREHNDANVLSLGARFLKEKEALAAIQLWLKTKFSGEAKHKRRIAKIDK